MNTIRRAVTLLVVACILLPYICPATSLAAPAAQELTQETPRTEQSQDDVIISTQKTSSGLDKQYKSDAPYALVSIRFPAEYSPHFVRNLNRLKSFRRDTSAMLRAFADEQVLKSAYCASELYDYLCARMPEDSIILEPAKLSFDTSGKVQCTPIRKAVPAAMTVDLFVGINPDRVRAPFTCKKGEDTFAESVSVYGTISKFTKNGVAPLAGIGLDDPTAQKSLLTVETFYNTICDGTKVKSQCYPSASSKNANAQRADGVEPLLAAYKCQPKIISEPERLIDGDGDVPCMRLWQAYSNIILTTLHNEDLKAVQPSLVAWYVEDIDPEIAELLTRGYQAGSGSETTERKLEVLTRYMENERKQIFSLQSKRMEESLYSGELGDSMRAMSKSEMEFAKKKSSSKRRQYAAEVLGLAAGVGSLVAALTLPTPAFSNVLTTVSFASVGIAQNEGKLQQRLRDVFQQFERQANETQTSFLLKFGSEALEVSGSNIDELRSKFRAKYQEQFEAYNSKNADL